MDEWTIDNVVKYLHARVVREIDEYQLHALLTSWKCLKGNKNVRENE